MFLKVSKLGDWVQNKTKNAKQEKALIFDVPMVPERLKDEDVPGWLLSISGVNQSCMGTLIAPNKFSIEIT